MKKLMLSLLAVQLLCTSPIFAQDETQDQLRGCCCHHSKNCTEPKGYIYRGYGPNLAPTGGDTYVKCNMFNIKGCQVGYTTSSATSNPNTAAHSFVLNDGGRVDVVFTQASDILNVVPVDSNTVIAFPETAPYLNNPNAALFILDGNHKINDAGTVAWTATGSLRKVNYIEVRCVYLTLSGNIIRCLGCHWTLAQTQS